MIKTTYKHLKDESYYSDLYDRFTVEECRRVEKNTKLEYEPEEKSKKGSKKKEPKVVIDLSSVVLPFLTGERYTKKSETIREWMAKDAALDRKLEDVNPPQNILCPSCGFLMEATMKDLQTELDERRNRVLFFFNCPKCKKNRLVYENGEEWRHPPTLCSKCKGVVNEKNSRVGNKITTIYTCPNCNHREKSILDLDEKPEPKKPDPNFEKDRERFCLSYQSGQAYIDYTNKIEDISKTLEEQKEQGEIRKKIAKIKKLNIANLYKILEPVLEKQEYTKLEFSKPEISRDIIVEFTVQDVNTERCEYDSERYLKRAIKKTLEETNWRLMSDGVYYKLGILSGRLRGYENDEDLLRLIKNKKNKK